MDEGKASSWSENNREGKVDDSWEEETEGKVASNNLGELAENAFIFTCLLTFFSDVGFFRRRLPRFPDYLLRG